MSKSIHDGKTYLVTGTGGFIGKHMAQVLLESGAEVIGIYNKSKPSLELNESSKKRIFIHKVDLNKPNELHKKYIEIGKNVDAVFHCAALDGNSQFKIEHSAEIIDSNNRMALDVLNLGKSFGIPSVVLLSSSEIYDSDLTGIITEKDDYNDKPLKSSNGYVLSKIFAELSAELYSKQYGLNVFLPRLGNVYGPGDHFGEQPSRVIPSMIQKVANNQQIEIWGDGKQSRQFIFVLDAVNAILQTVENNIQGPINVATDESISILDLAELVLGIMDHSESKITLDLTKPSGATERKLDTTKLYKTINFRPRSIRAGMVETINWYKLTFK